MKRFAIVTALLASVSSGSAFAAETIPLIVKNTSNYYFSIVTAGARKAAKELGIDMPVLGPTSFSDIQGQISILENAVSNTPTAIVISPLEFWALGGPITDAAGSLPIITVDSSADSSAVTAMVTTDNIEGGRQAAVALADAIRNAHGAPEGKVAGILGFAGQSTFEERLKGFKEKLASDYPKLELVSERIADGQATTAVNIMTDLLTSTPDIRGVFAPDLIMGAGAGQAVLENNVQDKVKVVAFDSDEKLVEFLANGAIAALIVQDPFRMGYEGVKAAYAASKGEKVNPRIDTGVNIITKANMSEPRSQELLNPKIN
ncbi:ABC transporter substrate-binding protein [Phyllobacterium chamaecytisi]|uniref:ABC transporter substrate-binding protein n=1 Tax=Phyllobacterium chamaecytisi TaxID=2876082 RepID=UPI001CC98432|nr:ABC transporter substrate-binding protein [Phyllobacterium sp. KW56]MBZ9606025.1 ABC transporter substrate-binding protein [Phyllobacterium sp. KW56]